MRRGAAAAALAETVLLTSLAACAALGGARPRYGPVPGAVFVQYDRPPAAVTAALAESLSRRGIPLRVAAPAEGYLETAWFEVGTARRTREPFGYDSRIVRLKFFADPAGGRTRMFAEAVNRVAWDPSVPERELERMVPENHPARALLRELIEGLGPIRPDTATARRPTPRG